MQSPLTKLPTTTAVLRTKSIYIDTWKTTKRKEAQYKRSIHISKYQINNFLIHAFFFNAKSKKYLDSLFYGFQKKAKPRDKIKL